MSQDTFIVRRDQPDAAARLAEELNEVGAADRVFMVPVFEAGDPDDDPKERSSAFVADEAGYVLTRATLVRAAEVALTRDPIDYFRIRIGLAKKATTQVDWLGTYDGSDQGLAVNEALVLTDTPTALPVGGHLYVEATTFGSPMALGGAGVQVQIGRRAT